MRGTATTNIISSDMFSGAESFGTRLHMSVVTERAINGDVGDGNGNGGKVEFLCSRSRNVSKLTLKNDMRLI